MLQRIQGASAILLLCLSVQSAAADATRVYLYSDISKTFRITPDDDKGSHTLEFRHGLLPLPSNAKINSCELHLVADETPGPHTGQDLDVYIDERQMGLGTVEERPLGRVAIQLRPEACDALARGALKIKITTASPASDRTYYGGLAEARYRPRVSLRYDTPEAPQLPWSAPETEPPAYATSPLLVRDSLTFLTNAYDDGASVIVAGESDGVPKLMKVSPYGAVSGVAIPPPLPGGSFAAGTDLGRTNIVGTGMVMSCDYDYLSRIQGCLGRDSKEVALQNGNTPAAGADGAIYFRDTREAREPGAIVGYNAQMEKIWVTEKNYDSIAPIALSLDGNQAFILGSLDTTQGRRIELGRIRTDTGESYPGVEFTDRKSGATMLFAELFRPAVHTETVERRVIHYLAMAANTSDEGRIQLFHVAENRPGSGIFRPPEFLFQFEGKIGAPPRFNPATGRLFAVLGGYLVEIDWRSTGDDAKLRRILAVPDAGPGKIFFDPAGGAYLITKGHLCPAKFSLCRAVDLPADYDTDGMLFHDDRVVAYARQGIFEFSPRASEREIRPLTMLAGRTYAARRVVLGADAHPVGESGRVIVRAGRTSMTRGFSWPRGHALEVQAIRTTDGP